MDNRLQALAGEQAGAFSSTQALARGVDPLELRAALRRGEVVRVRRGAYVARGAWDAADQDGRYLLTALATVHTRPGDALSHHEPWPRTDCRCSATIRRASTLCRTSAKR